MGPRLSIASAPPRKDIYLIWGQFGMIGGARILGGRLWQLADGADPDAGIICRIAWNSPVSGQVVYEDLGVVSSARIRNNQTAEVYSDAGFVTMVAAPCVCGAGSVGQAGPDEGRISLTYVNPHGRPGLTVT